MDPSPRSTFVPMYYQLARLLEQKIDANEYAPGSRLPTEAKLAADYDVSVITARSAMKVLLDRGRVERFPGRGTFVLERTPQRTAWGLGSIDDIVMTTTNSELTMLDSAMIESPEWVWRAFHLEGPSSLHWMRNVRSVNDERFMVSDIYHHPDITLLVRGRRFRELARERKLVITAVCEMAGATLGEIRQSLGAALATPDIAAALLTKEGSPLLVVERLFMDTQGRVLQVGKTHYRVDHYRYDLNLTSIERNRAERSPRRTLALAAGGRGQASKP